MSKRIPCKRCSGKGYIYVTYIEGNTGTATSHICPECCGAGVQFAPSTNADRIRAMCDEELAELLLDGCRGSKCDDQPQNEWGSVNCFQCRMNWLQQPAGEEDKHENYT